MVRERSRGCEERARERERERGRERERERQHGKEKEDMGEKGEGKEGEGEEGEEEEEKMEVVEEGVKEEDEDTNAVPEAEADTGEQHVNDNGRTSEEHDDGRDQSSALLPESPDSSTSTSCPSTKVVDRVGNATTSSSPPSPSPRPIRPGSRLFLLMAVKKLSEVSGRGAQAKALKDACKEFQGKKRAC